MEYAKQCMNMCVVNTRCSADPVDLHAQSGLIGAPQRMIAKKPPMAQVGGVGAHSRGAGEIARCGF
jgi:hypothetical protein